MTEESVHGDCVVQHSLLSGFPKVYPTGFFTGGVGKYAGGLTTPVFP